MKTHVPLDLLKATAASFLVGGVVDIKHVLRTKALPIAYDILLEELLQFSKAIAQAIDTSKFVSKESIVSLTNSILQASQVASSMEVSIQGKPENGLEGLKDALDFIKAEKICSLSKSKLLSLWRSNALLVELIFKSSVGKTKQNL
ncbi:hypothetical protein K1719_020858 [Acacia pycnantha]|nr:hypothetical protein K1719_020858 [Acacia pycnantha]